MKLPASFVVAAALFACMSTSYPANADDSGGTCNIQPNDVLATFGFAASGQALEGNALGVPVGAFSQVGVATGITAGFDGSGKHIVGKWSIKFEQNDSSGAPPSTFTFPGTFTINTIDCTGQFSWNFLGKVVFAAVFVGHATEFRSMSVLKGIIISYTSGKKL